MIKFSKDTQRIPPAVKSREGLKGPTILVSFPTEKGMRALVVKALDDVTQMATNRAYEAFSRGFSDEGVCCGFSRSPLIEIRLCFTCSRICCGKHYKTA